MRVIRAIGFISIAVLLHAQDPVSLDIGGQNITFRPDDSVKVVRIVKDSVGELAAKTDFTGRFQAFAAASADSGALAVSRSLNEARPSNPSSFENHNQAQPVLTARLGAPGDLVALYPEMVVQFTSVVNDAQARRLLRIYGATSAAATQIAGRYLVSMPSTDAMVNAVKNMKQNATIPSQDRSGRIQVVDYIEPNLYYIRPSMVQSVQAILAPVHHRTAAAPPGTPVAAPTPALGPAAGVDWRNTITDDYFADEWPLDSLMTTPATELGILRAWSEFGYQGDGVKVAVVDDGVDLNHEDLQASIAGYWDTTVNAPPGATSQSPYTLQSAAVHGTLCAGLIAARINGKGIVGVAPAAKIIALKAATYGVVNGVSAWVNSSFALADAIDRARTMGADVISASWGMPLENADIRNAITRAGNSDRRIILVFAAGNLQKVESGQQYAIDFPARLSNDTTVVLGNGAIISVGASTPCDSLKTYQSCDNETDWASKYTPNVTVLAPGTSMPSTLPGNQYSEQFRGTSAATPIVAGVVALMLSKEPALSAQQVLARITRLSKKVGSVQNQELHRVDAYCLLQNPAAGCQ